MGWLADLFAPGRATNARTLDHTGDAFALPVPAHNHPDAFNRPPTPALYTYPPQSPQSYGYVPTSSVFAFFFLLRGLARSSSSQGRPLPRRTPDLPPPHTHG
jgi:hypothetical protein